MVREPTLPPAGDPIPCPYTGDSGHGAFRRGEELWCDTCDRKGEPPLVASVAPLEEGWPVLDRQALHGLAGDVVAALAPHTESDPVAILVQLLVYFGNAVGPNPHFQVEADRHGMNLFVVLVGETAKARKGTSAGQIRRIFKEVDPEWVAGCLAHGLSSGEGLINLIRDSQEKNQPIKEGGRVTGYQPVVVDHGVEDKRALIIEEEFASPLKVMRREGNTLSPVIRCAWDGKDLRTLTKNSPQRASEPHVSIIGHVTRDELLRHLGTTEAGNGFGNRFLWCLVRRSKCLPEGGSLSTEGLRPLVQRLRSAVDFARSRGELRRSAEARELWSAVYPALSEGKPGLLGAMIARAEAQVTRLSAIYALLDGSAEILPEHLLAALALWDYLEASARYVFGTALGDPTADELLQLLREAPGGLTRTEIRDHFSRHKPAEIDRALKMLEGQGLANRKDKPTAGRPAELWAAATKAT